MDYTWPMHVSVTNKVRYSSVFFQSLSLINDDVMVAFKSGWRHMDETHSLNPLDTCLEN